MKVVNVQEAKTQLSRLLERVAAGEVILLGKHGKPMAKLTAFNPAGETRPLGGFEGRIRSSGFRRRGPAPFALFSGTDE